MQKQPDRRPVQRPDGKLPQVNSNAPQPKKKSSSAKMLFKGVVVIMLISSVFVFASRLMKYNELKQEKEKLQEQIQQHQDDINKLNRDIVAPMDDEYIIKVAREKLNLYFPDETIFYGGVK